ncbi:MAG: sugar ABC transporter permease [Methylobacteriaceae bacterium]|nr:sugar ABC transporter permease [Methylobacteriaceae bacterium]MBV9246374.1 sugar ABC transporter permease [Methylobacteriaceae bacterium]MBV9635596.1 sugar ABC transporter permease [Methylobacteriaceae bacterium]MBV9701410.1 sugar ABC transporter permease [Methylobacteriaceae bacterium]
MVATTTTSSQASHGGVRSGRGVDTRPLIWPSVGVLLIWMIIPLALTLWFSIRNYKLDDPSITGFAGLGNYSYLLTDPSLTTALLNTLLLVGGVLIATVVFGTLFAVLFDQDFWGKGVARLLVIAPFFVMPTVAALVWKNLLMDPVNGLFAFITRSLGLGAITWFSDMPLFSIGIIVAWQWIPFATLILLTAMQSLDREQIEAARMDGAKAVSRFIHIIVPHLGRPITVVVMIETIFLLSVFAEILVTTSGGPGDASTNLTYLIYKNALLDFDVGLGSAGGVIAIVLANIVAFFLVRTVARNLDA